VHIPEIRRSEHALETKKEENKLKQERQDSQENNKSIRESLPMTMSALKLRKSINSKAESVKYRDKRVEFLDEAEKDENSLNNKDLESEISHYKKNNNSDSNLNVNLDVYEGVSQHAFQEVN